MNYDELVKDLRYCGDAGKSCLQCKFRDNYCFQTLAIQAADAIEDLENKLNLWRQDKISRWIPVTERVPEKRHSVLIFTEKGGVAEGKFNGDGWSQYRWSAKMGMGVVTHWMPLPTPPASDPCDGCRHSPPSSTDGKPCTMCDLDNQMMNCRDAKEKEA